MARRDAPAPVLDAVQHLDALAKAGVIPFEVASEARAIAVRWWWQGRGEPHPGGLVAMVAELRRWCAVTSAEHAVRWDKLSRAGRALGAERERQQAAALDEAWLSLGFLSGCDA